MRTTAVAVAVVGVSLLVGAVALVASLDQLLKRELRVTMTVRAAETAHAIRAGADPVASVVGDDDLVVQVLGGTGEVLAASSNVAGQPALARIAPGTSQQRPVPFDDDEFLIVAAAADDGRVVLVGHSIDGVTGSTRVLTALLAVGLPALLVVVGVTAWRAIGRALAPVDTIRAEVDEITGTRLDRRVRRPPSQDEIGRLADTMNQMLKRLERARDRERRFIADASHELRSPIAAIRQQAEVALAHPEALPDRELAGAVHIEARRMQALVDDLLLLAQADEARLPFRRTAIDLDDLAFAQARRVRADKPGLVVDVQEVSAARVEGDPPALQRVLRNLGDNAARHARARVAFGVAEVDGWAVLWVEDDGPGVPADDRLRVFDRFVRLDGGRDRAGGGSGLGLAIVAEVVAAHRGTVVLDGSHLGGARVTVRLPFSVVSADTGHPVPR
ncbi:sensor histidine kinase [Plantactinospora mayteni]|uniref:histidine kinase n=1 Tax=Plantactinospora mayteni TaxID=566021 RepID=A0ABQ4F4N8_9ACTN|nr:HAMP domain-containing sensor histidine kinase [Plantactinospora mayteni]GIH01835.1 two-component sensor histidine kinase [Plantactinospora mayteni]